MRIFPVLILSFFSAVAFAKEYDVAGCGLGSMIWGDEPKTHIVLMVEASTNASSLSQSLGISSDSSNCVDARSYNASVKVKMYIDANRVALAKDIARGNGEALGALSRLLNCVGAPVGPTLQKNYLTIFPNDQVPSEEVSKSIRSILRSNDHQCLNLG